MVRIQQTKRGQYWITIPKAIIKMFGWKKGDELIIGLNKKKDVTLNPVKT